MSLRHRANLHVDANFSQKHNASIFDPEDGNNIFLRKAGICLRVHTVSQLRRITSTSRKKLGNTTNCITSSVCDTDITPKFLKTRTEVSSYSRLCQCSVKSNTSIPRSRQLPWGYVTLRTKPPSQTHYNFNSCLDVLPRGGYSKASKT
jgi:hypothetical protein